MASVYVDVDLDEFTDKDIINEHIRRVKTDEDYREKYLKSFKGLPQTYEPIYNDRNLLYDEEQILKLFKENFFTIKLEDFEAFLKTQR